MWSASRKATPGLVNKKGKQSPPPRALQIRDEETARFQQQVTKCSDCTQWWSIQMLSIEMQRFHKDQSVRFSSCFGRWRQTFQSFSKDLWDNMCAWRSVLVAHTKWKKKERKKVKLLSSVWLFVTPWTVACQAPLSMGFSRQEYWSGLPFPSPGGLPSPGWNPGLQACRQTLYHLSHQESQAVYKRLFT